MGAGRLGINIRNAFTPADEGLCHCVLDFLYQFGRSVFIIHGPYLKREKFERGRTMLLVLAHVKVIG